MTIDGYNQPTVADSGPAESISCCRYCEFNSRPDPTRGASWNKIAASLLVVHCSQYVLALDSGGSMLGLVFGSVT